MRPFELSQAFRIGSSFLCRRMYSVEGRKAGCVGLHGEQFSHRRAIAESYPIRNFHWQAFSLGLNVIRSVFWRIVLIVYSECLGFPNSRGPEVLAFSNVLSAVRVLFPGNSTRRRQTQWPEYRQTSGRKVPHSGNARPTLERV